MTEPKKEIFPKKPQIAPDMSVSIRQLPKLDVQEDVKGENLGEFSDTEWDASEEPFSAELLNVKNAPNRISVFSGPKRFNDPQIIKKKVPKAQPNPPKIDNRASQMAKMMENVFEKLVDGRSSDGIKNASIIVRWHYPIYALMLRLSIKHMLKKVSTKATKIEPKAPRTFK
ncbi:unnamed protein product [Caenorhabditis angaria]|uniref:Uncharacterized protein n=1 Tax=Caenorhabditis angaria TaxID=860376 RepID=A0A9P1N215_9PELO|nr:unnamed protein product [Caenorhabditis angaria]